MQQHFYRFFPHALQKHTLGSWRLLALAAGFILGCLVLFTYSHTGSAGFPDNSVSVSSELSKSKSSSSPYTDAKSGAEHDADEKKVSCFIDLNLLRLHADNSSTVDYARLNIGVLRTENFTTFPDSLDLSIPKYRSVRLDTEANRETRSDEDCTTSLTIQAPIAAARPDASHMVFGVATSLEKLEESLDAFAHWAGDTKTRIIAVVEQGGSSTRTRIQQRASELGVRLTITQTEDDRLDRYFSLIQVLFQYRDTSTKWAVLIDDDTFFPSMTNLVAKLASYDATIPQYIGGMTEDLARLSGSGYMAYGGAGIFLSIPLLEDLQYVFETCHSFKDKGDRMLASCIYAHTTAKFTWERGLYQLDIHSDASGFFESGRPLPLSVHHWKSWFQADMVALGKAAAICGDECLLHRFHLSKDWFLVNGYSVIQDATLWNDPRPMEQTWDKSNYKGSDPFAYSLGPLRRLDQDKVSFRLRDAGAIVAEGDQESQETPSSSDPIPDQLRQLYVLNATDERPPQVLEVVWTVVDDNHTSSTQSTTTRLA